MTKRIAPILFALALTGCTTDLEPQDQAIEIRFPPTNTDTRIQPFVGKLPAHTVLRSQVCARPALKELDVVRSMALDTENPEACTGGIVQQTHGSSVCIVHARSLYLAEHATLSVSGSNALALVADDDAIIDGTIDLGADHGEMTIISCSGIVDITGAVRE